MIWELGTVGLDLEEVTGRVAMCSLVSGPSLLVRVTEAQSEDAETATIRARVTDGIDVECWELSPDWGLRYHGGLLFLRVVGRMCCESHITHDLQCTPVALRCIAT